MLKRIKIILDLCNITQYDFGRQFNVKVKKVLVTRTSNSMTNYHELQEKSTGNQGTIEFSVLEESRVV